MSETKTNINFELSDLQKELVRDCAKKEGLLMSSFIRQTILKKCAEILREEKANVK